MSFLRCVHKAVIAEHSTLICFVKSKLTSYKETETSYPLPHEPRGIRCIQFTLLRNVIKPINPGTRTSMNQNRALFLHVATPYMSFKLTFKSQKYPSLNLVSRAQLYERLKVVFKQNLHKRKKINCNKLCFDTGHFLSVKFAQKNHSGAQKDA